MMWSENDNPDVICKTIPYKGGMAVFCTEFFKTKAPHDDPRISVRLLNSKGEQTAFRIIDENLGLPVAEYLSVLSTFLSTIKAKTKQIKR